ncbi:transcription activator of gluconeogenesis [Xylaria sp. CBS 124048]|nr:transcription activator of gluconeogenesis [Xylaria sp. CBS 124048]
MPGDVQANGAEVSDAMSDNDIEPDELDHPNMKEENDKMPEQHTSPEAVSENSTETKKKYDPKDPHRPRRKKARRACYACQRAHLTCGDERPCTRCIKRGLADACQDGVRKKAKYLHDAPPEALRPVLGYNPNAMSKPNGRQVANDGSDPSAYYSQSANTATYPMFAGAGQNPVTGLPDGLPYGSQQSSVANGFQSTSNGAQLNGIPVHQVPADMGSQFSTPVFDPSNPSIFNFDLEGLNFGSHYGALEFGILGHMSSGAAETPPREAMAQATSNDVGYGPPPMFSNGASQYNQIYNQGLVENFMNVEQHSAYSQGNLQHGLPHAYAVPAAGPTPSSLASPGTENTPSPQPTSYGFDKSSPPGTYTSVNPQSIAQTPRPKSKTANVNAPDQLGSQQAAAKRRDPSSIYETVKEPYSYLTGFHNLIAFVQRRFSPNKTLRIAKSLASIRPSFIACTRNLNRQDLIFMEKCFQRTLFEYEDYMVHCSAPTIVCRRTGEVAAVNKEFIALTGWSKNVLLGKEPNMNVNLGRSGLESGSLTSKSELATPRLMTAQPDSVKNSDGGIQPVFIAEFMDDDSVIQFYEDFAQLAFGDSRGCVTRKCRLLKYRTKEMDEALASEESPQKTGRNSILSNRVTKIDGEHGISKLEKDGKIDCTFCWTIKRDVFDIPMLIIINFLPCYYREQDQLAV